MESQGLALMLTSLKLIFARWNLRRNCRKPSFDAFFLVLSSVAAASEYASKGLEKLGEKLPLLQKPVEQVRIQGCAVPRRQRGLVLVGFLSLGAM